jgi:hypothetical protein
MTPNQEDTSGVNCMGYRDYCISVVDKVMGTFRTGGDMVTRRLESDALRMCIIDEEDEVTSEYPGLPDSLPLGDHVTQTGMFFDPQVRGFYYVEVYDPQYWVDVRGIRQQRCFHPMYRMRSRNTRSPLDFQTVAVWLDKYSIVEPDAPVPPAQAARSVHFGMPLWFFDHARVDSIANVVFEEWGLAGE